MKYPEVDMQEIPRQISPLTQNSMHGIPDRSNWRSKHMDLSNGNGTKDSPEIIDLDNEESPVKEKLDSAIAVNGVTTTVKKVSLPWQDKVSSDEAKKSNPASREEDENSRKPPTVNSTAKEVLPSTEEEDNASKKVSEGERKRPITEEVNDGSSKKPRTSDAADESLKVSPPAPSEVNGIVEKDVRKSPQVSVVDLVDEEEDISVAQNEKILPKTGADDAQPKNVSQNSANVKVVSSEPPVSLSVESVSSSAPVGAVGPVSDNAQSSSSLPVEDKRTKSLPSSLNAAASAVLSQMQQIEVKKVKLRPSLEKQASAMSSGVSVNLKSSSESPKLVPPTTLVQNQALSSTTPQDAPEAPKPSSSDAAKESSVESEPPVCGRELEKKVKLNPAHSLTRKSVRKLTRADLETYLMEVTCELVFSKSEAGKYRRMYEEMKEISENKSMKLAHLIKQVSDLKAVVANIVEDQKERRDVLPRRITRSVGLQLDSSNIANAHKFKSKTEKLHIISASSNLGSSPPSNADRSQQQRWNRSASSTSNPTVTSSPNGAVTSPMKDGLPGNSSMNRSPQRQLRALHPKIPQGSPSISLSQSGSSQPTAANEPTNKSPGFIDISEEGKVLNTGTTVSVKRHQQMVANSQSPSTSTNVGVNSVTNHQVTPQTMKVVQQHYGQPGTVYPQTSGAPRMVSPVSMPSTSPVAGPRLTYLIPATRTVQASQRQIVLTTPAAAPQIRGPSPSTQVSSVQMLMRPNTIVQVSSSAIASPSTTTYIRTMPNSTIQALPAVKNPQQHASRVMSMQPRPPAPPVRPPPLQHPAPLPSQPQPTVVNPTLKPIPRRPVLKLSKVPNGIVLSWNMTNNTPHEEIASYQLYAYQEGSNTPPSPSLWKKVGDVKALPLPMACTLTQFADGHRYHFAVRALDVHGRVGEFSVPGTIDLFN